MQEKKSLEYYNDCSELPLKIFFKIAETANVELLLKGEEKYFDKGKLVDAWEKILMQYTDIDKNQMIANVLETKQEIFKQAALYCEIKGMLIYLFGEYKPEYVDRLRELGYPLDTSTNTNLITSIKKADQRSNQISTRMQFLQKDLESYDTEEKSSFDSVMAWISSELGFEPKEDITVLRYLEYKKRIKEKRKKK